MDDIFKNYFVFHPIRKVFNRSKINWANRLNVIACKLCTMNLEKRDMHRDKVDLVIC